MARINNRPSTVNGSVRATPALGNSSDQENEEPTPQRRDKGKGRAVDMPNRSLPTPSTDGTETSRGQKRKRNEVQHATQADDISDNEDPNEARFNRYYDPAQNPEKRRQLLRKSRAITRDFHEKRDDLLKGDASGISETINRANNVFKNVKQTNDATLDSRLFVDVSGLTKKKTQQLVLGDSQAGLDSDTLVSKVIYFLQHGAPMNAEESAAATQRATQRRQRRANDDDDEDDDEDDHGGEPFDWEHFGRHACFPYNSRPACPSFLLGPLSVEKKVRKQTQRTARQRQDPNVREVRPEALTRADMSQTDENTLTAQCYKIKKQLQQYIDQIDNEIAEAFPTQAAMDTPEGKARLKERRFTSAGGPSLFGCVLNPHSFGQTVENIFYISFLIKEGYLGIVSDGEGMPTLLVTEPSDPEQARKDDANQRITSKTGLKHQAVIGIDWDMWEDLVEAFDIDEPMIPHRDEDEGQQIGARGWYT